MVSASPEGTPQQQLTELEMNCSLKINAEQETCQMEIKFSSPQFKQGETVPSAVRRAAIKVAIRHLHAALQKI